MYAPLVCVTREFQSSAAPLERLQHHDFPERFPVPCFNPQPPSRAAATVRGRRTTDATVVSILSRPLERLQLPRRADRWREVTFQSSAALSSGCNFLHPRAWPRKECFNPQPPSRAAATGSAAHAPRLLVSILSRPLERLQRLPSATDKTAIACFNPQPPSRAAATYVSNYSVSHAFPSPPSANLEI